MQYRVEMEVKNGCSSSDFVTVTVSNDDCGVSSKIVSVSPTPATDIVNVNYDLVNTNNAKLRLIKMDNSVDELYELDMATTEKVINVNSCSMGIYSVILICDDVVKDHKTIIIQ